MTSLQPSFSRNFPKSKGWVRSRSEAVRSRLPGANIIDTVDRVRGLLPQLRASISPAINLAVMIDRTTTIRASIEDVELTMMISIGLVILVVFLFLRDLWTTVIPSVVVP